MFGTFSSVLGFVVAFQTTTSTNNSCNYPLMILEMPTFAAEPRVCEKRLWRLWRSGYSAFGLVA